MTLDWQAVKALAAVGSEKVVLLSSVSRTILFAIMSAARMTNTNGDDDAAQAALDGTIFELMNEYDGVNMEYAEFADMQPNGTSAGGTTSSTNWQVRALNTELVNQLASGGLLFNAILLDQGDWLVNVEFPVNYTANQRTLLLALGTPNTPPMPGYEIFSQSPAFGRNASSTGEMANWSTVINLRQATAVSLLYRINDTKSGNGLGQASSAGFLEKYASVRVLKL